MLAQGLCLCSSDAVCPVAEVCVLLCGGSVMCSQKKKKKKVEIVESINVCAFICVHTRCVTCVRWYVCVCAGCVISAVCVLIAC